MLAIALCFCNTSDEFYIARLQLEPLRAFLGVDYPVRPFGAFPRPLHAVADLIVKVLEHDMPLSIAPTPLRGRHNSGA